MGLWRRAISRTDVESIAGQGTAFQVRVPRGRNHLPSDGIGAARELDATQPVRVPLDGQPSDAVRLTVHNYGVPITPEFLPLLFNPFARAEKTGGHSQGLGLGLYISERIIDAHGGQLTAPSSAALEPALKLSCQGVTHDRRATLAGSAEEALELLDDLRPCRRARLLMPGMKGGQLLDLIRKRPDARHLAGSHLDVGTGARAARRAHPGKTDRRPCALRMDALRVPMQLRSSQRTGAPQSRPTLPGAQ